MLTCKQVSESLAKERYENMSLARKIGLRIHVFLCMFCGRYNKQVVDMQKGAHRFTEQEQEILNAEGVELSEEGRARIKTSIKDEQG